MGSQQLLAPFLRVAAQWGLRNERENTVSTLKSVMKLDTGFLCQLHVPTPALKTLSGRQIIGVEEGKKADGTPSGRFQPVRKAGYWLDKYFGVFVENEVGMYDLSAWDLTGTSRPESLCVEVTQDEAGAFSLTEVPYKEMLRRFGVAVSDATAEGAERPQTAMAAAISAAGITS